MTEIKKSWWQRPVSIVPLVIFRMAFGILMFGSLLRFLWRGWVDTLYIQPGFHFTYWGFEWVQPFAPAGMYLLFGIVLISALCVALGLFYRVAIVLFFLGFTYIELIDATTYLNHYYFISLVAFIMSWLPAHRWYSLDVLRLPAIRQLYVPAWMVYIIRFQLGVVYVFAGIAKLNASWLLDAEPMKTWLPARSHLPVVGPFMYEEWVAYLFSWFGAVYDCCIVFFLLWSRTRPYAYAVVVVFHIATAIFFPGIGMFPYVMIAATLIFFDWPVHAPKPAPVQSKQWVAWVLALYICLQIIIPLRSLLYPGRLFWHEEGYRFSWRVMLMEKAGVAYFTVKDAQHATVINNAAYLTPLQEKMMSTQPDMILKYAHHLRDAYARQGWDHPAVYATVYVSLNGSRSSLFIDSTVNLSERQLSWGHYDWVIPSK